MPEKRKLSLDVQLLETEEHCGVKHHRTRDVPEGDPEPMSTDEPQEPDSATSGEHITEESDSILVIDSGAQIDEDVLEMYFENTKRSGGGPIKQMRCDRKGIQITFENIEDAKNVLSRRHSVQNILLQVQPCLGPSVVKEQPPTPPSSSSSSVVLENVPETMNREMLTMLVENTSGLDGKDFKLEHISERNVAVVTFRTSESAMGFMQTCTHSARVKSHGITSRLLECTKSIKVEDLPPDVCTEFLNIYFESSKHGGGRVADVQSLPEEDSAIVTFFDQKVITTVLAEPHMMKGKAVSVYPYYLTLDSALYGKERPVMKLPELIRLPISPYIWHYLQKDEKSLQDLKNEMSASYCELTWPDSGTPCTEVILVPDASLSKQRMILFKVAKTWDEEVPKKFSSIMEKFKVIEHSVDREMWEVMKKKVTSAVGVEVVIIPDVSSNKVGLAGILEKVVQMDLRFKEILQQTTKETERKAQSICEHLRVSPSEYAILCCDKLEEDIHKTFPEMEMAFEVSTSRITFFGLPLEVVVAKSKILEWEQTLKQKTLNVNPYVLRFIQQVDNDDLSYILLTDKKINAFCKTETTMVLLKGNSQKAIEEAEKQIKESIIYTWVDLQDSSVIKMKEWHTLRSSLLETFNSGRPAVLIEIEENRIVIIGYSVAVTEISHQVSNFIDENTQIKKSIPLRYEVVAQFLQEEKKQVFLEFQKKNIKIDFNLQTMKRHLLLSGPRRDVQVMAGVVQQVLSSLHSNILSINKPGAKKFSQKSEEMLFITGKQKFNCYVRLAKNGEECEEYSEVEAGLPSYHVHLQGGIVVGVYNDDLPKHPVDVVVNASNEDLKHIGGVALALLKAAGPELQTESDNIVESQGKLKPGHAVITSAGNLPCKQVIHAVGPRWHEFTPASAESLLKKCIKASLELAELYNHKSIGIPAISSGIFGFPLDLCVNCIVVSLKEHMEARNWKSCLHHIHFVDNCQKTVDAFTCALKKHFGGGPQFITGKQKFNCYMRLAKNGEECEEYSEVEAGLPSYQVNLQGGIVVGVYNDDLPKHPVDVVVNASNEDLKHIGGVALALLKAAGPELQTESDNIVESQGKLKPGHAVITSAGNLPCKQVIHAVGPRWHEFTPASAESLLKTCIKASLELAELYNHKSIGIPAISSGIFGFPLDLCVNCIVVSLKEHMEARNWKSCLHHIHFVDKCQKTVDAFTCALKKHFGGGPQLQTLPTLTSHAKLEKRKPRNQQDVQLVKTEEGLAIILEQGNIQDATTDVIVNSVATDLQLHSGAVSKALLQKAGPQLQELLDSADRLDNVDVGSVLPTDGCNLSCKNIFHVICPIWKTGQSSEELRDLIKECLKRTESKHFKSITFPAIGTGNLGFPKPVVAASMFEEVIESSRKMNFRNLQEVHFMLHPTDTDNITAFSDEFEKRFGGKVEYKKGTEDVSANASASKSSVSIGSVTVPTLGVYEMLIGPVKLQVKSGDITKESTDVIVNSSNQTFNLKQGVSKKILEAAGQIVEQECAQKATLPNNGSITTTNGALACKNIIHVVGQTDLQQIKTTVNNVLQECEQRQLTSVAFPALGTGQGGVNPSLVADAIIDALVDFASQKNASSVQNVAIIIFQTQMLEQFHTSMKKKQGTRLPEEKYVSSRRSSSSAVASIFSIKRPSETKKSSSFVFEDKIEPAIFQICGENPKNVKDTASWIEELIKNEYCDSTIRDEWIAEFEEKEHQELTELQNSLQIRIQVKCKQDDASIQVSGLTREVMTACMEIQNMIKKISKEARQKRQEELVSNIVEWQYDNGGTFVAFHKQANLQLEKAFTENVGTVKIQNGHRTYHVNLEAESAIDDKKHTVKIKRTSKIEGENDIPAHWESVSANKVNRVQLSPQTKEYKDVEALFKKTCTHTIHKIERLQNVFLWKNYMIKKLSIDDKNGSQNNERLLFHGTAQAHLTTILKNGFNRSFAGMNAAVYGNGTYFAVNASYSAHDTYSKPDASGMKYMYLTRVLTGLFCAGRKGILTPPAKNTQDPTDLYDSVTDNVENPNMFVVFNDVQAYPEYVISFK
ncbi:protein mono-ADP-ribosyltransferase PARP14-like isoform X2 [Lissotriton helveticus]